MDGIVMITSAAYAGHYIGIGDPHADGCGYAVDDPPEAATYRCDECGGEFSEGEPHILACEETDDKDLCAVCARARELEPTTQQ